MRPQRCPDHGQDDPIAILNVTEATKAQAEITVEYTYNKAGLAVKQTETLRILDRNASSWDDDRKAAAFVTAKDPQVLGFAKRVANDAKSRAKPAAVNAAFRISSTRHCVSNAACVSKNVNSMQLP